MDGNKMTKIILNHQIFQGLQLLKTFEPKVKWKSNELLNDETCKLGVLRLPFKSFKKNNHFDLAFLWFIRREKMVFLSKLGHGHEFYEFVLPCGLSTQHFGSKLH
jgi:hypothetical protein